MYTRIILFLIVALLITTESSHLYAQSEQDGGHVFFFMGKRQYYQLDNTYSMQLWAYVPPNHRWKVGSSIINIEYDNTALRAVTSDTVWDSWSEFRNKGYLMRQSDYGTATSLSIITFSTNYAVIEGGEAIHLGTLRWQVLDGSKEDDFFMRTDSTHALVSIVLDSTFQLKPMRADFNTRWTWRSISPRVIDPSTVACDNVYFRAYTCEEEVKDTTLTPLQDSCMYWHRTMTPTGVGPHIISYQPDWISAPIGTERVLHFLTQSLDSLLAVVRCKWEKQADAGYIEWRKLENKIDGGLIRWSNQANDFGLGFGTNVLGLTFSALHPNDLTKIVAAGECGEGGRRFGMSTILLNDSPEFYRTNPHLRWTTDFHTCGYSPRCLDVETIILHEMGHYIGLGHQKQPLSVLWSGYDSRNIHIHQCESNAMRRFYSPQLLDKTPVPPPDNSPCLGPTDVEEQPTTNIIVDTDVWVYPTPVTDNRLSIRAEVRIPTRVALSIVNLTGQTIQKLSDTYQLPGKQEYSFNLNLTPGVYFLKVETQTNTSIKKIVVLR